MRIAATVVILGIGTAAQAAPFTNFCKSSAPGDTTTIEITSGLLFTRTGSVRTPVRDRASGLATIRMANPDKKDVQIIRADITIRGDVMPRFQGRARTQSGYKQLEVELSGEPHSYVLVLHTADGYSFRGQCGPSRR